MGNFLILIFVIIPAFAHAQENPKISAESTKVEVNEEDHTIRFIIDGEEAAILSKSGFFVRDSIEYGGTIRDNGGEKLDNEDVIQPIHNEE